jgi:putative tricarboxylic transport membrane protein
VFWSNWLVGSITTLALILLFWPLLHSGFDRLSGLWRPAQLPRAPAQSRE